ncbi:MAG: hypothetical protein ACKOEO_24475 [Planctomycetaceae bacterium]
MSFDPALILLLLNHPNVTAASSLVSFISFVQGIDSFFEESRRHEAQGTIDEYLEWLRRREHFELVSLLHENRETFERVFRNVDNTYHAIKRVDQKIENLTKELTELKVDPSKIDLQISGKSWSPEFSISIGHERQSTRLIFPLTIINRNLSELTVTSVSGWVSHGNDLISLKSRDEKTVVKGNGSSCDIMLITARQCSWQQGDDVSIDCMTLRIVQVNKELKYTSSGGLTLQYSGEA